MPSVGERLREARESQGRNISQVAAETRIDIRYLKAIEAGDLSQLPGGFFTRSFVRQYARLLDVSMDDIANDLERWLADAHATEAPDLQPKTMRTGLAPVPHVLEGGRRPRRKIVGAVVALVLVIGACAAVYSYWLSRQESPLVSVLPKDTPLQAEAAPASPPLPAEPAPGKPPASATATSRAGEPVAGKPPASAAATPPTGATPARVGPLWFVLSATDEVWVRVKTGDRTLFVGILDPGDSRRFQGLEQASLRVGNAGGLNLSVNGQPARRVGPLGQIRIVNLTPDQTQIIAVPRRPAAPDLGAVTPDDETDDAQ